MVIRWRRTKFPRDAGFDSRDAQQPGAASAFLAGTGITGRGTRWRSPARDAISPTVLAEAGQAIEFGQCLLERLRRSRLPLQNLRY